MQIIVMTSDNYYHCLEPFMYLWQRFFINYTEFPWLHNELDLGALSLLASLRIILLTNGQMLYCGC
jgi:hypothetical protein